LKHGYNWLGLRTVATSLGI